MDEPRNDRVDDGGPSAVAALAAVVSDPVFSTDLEGVVDVWNPAAEQLWRIPAAEAVGSRLPHFAPSNRRRFIGAVRRVAGTTETAAIVESTQRAGRGPIRCEFTLVPLPLGRSGRGAVLAVVGEAQVRWSVEELVSSAPGLISERLRTPLAAVLGYAQVLARPRRASDRARRARAAQGISERGEEVMTALEDLSVLERVVSGRPPLEVTVTDPAGLLAEAVGAAEAAVRGCRFVAELDSRTGLVDVDPRVLRHVIDGALIRAALDRPAGADVGVTLTRTEVVATIVIEASARPGSRGAGVEATEFGVVVMSRVAQAHGGSAEESRLPDGGRTTILRLPLRTEG